MNVFSVAFDQLNASLLNKKNLTDPKLFEAAIKAHEEVRFCLAWNCYRTPVLRFCIFNKGNTKDQDISKQLLWWL